MTKTASPEPTQQGAMITAEEVIALVQHKLRATNVDCTELNTATQLGDIEATSLQLAEIIFAVEERHGIQIDTSQLSETQTIGELVALANEPGAPNPIARTIL